MTKIQSKRTQNVEKAPEVDLAGGGNPSEESLCQNCESKHLGLFCGLSPEGYQSLNSMKRNQHYKTGDVVFRAGDHPQGIYCIKSGSVKIEAIGQDGQAHILHVVNSGGILGLKASLDEVPYEANAIVLQPAEMCIIHRPTFQTLLETNPSVAIKALRASMLELHEMEKRFCHATDLTAVERIAEALLHLKDRFESHRWSRREFAEWASTTTETVIRTLSQFEKEGLIQLDGRKIIIKDRKGLLEKAKIMF